MNVRRYFWPIAGIVVVYALTFIVYLSTTGESHLNAKSSFVTLLAVPVLFLAVHKTADWTYVRGISKWVYMILGLVEAIGIMTIAVVVSRFLP